MKFINYLERITGVGIYPLLSLVIFFTIFSIMTLWVFKADKRYMKSMKYIPFPDNENE